MPGSLLSFAQRNTARLREIPSFAARPANPPIPVKFLDTSLDMIVYIE
jgi:hypothetical protein